MHQIDETAGCRHDDIHPFLQGTHLGFDGRTAIDCFHMYSVHILRKVADVIRNLQTEFSRRTQYQRLCLPTVRINPLQQWNTERCRLDIPPLWRNQIGYHLFLHRHRLHKS